MKELLVLEFWFKFYGLKAVFAGSIRISFHQHPYCWLGEMNKFGVKPAGVPNQTGRLSSLYGGTATHTFFAAWLTHAGLINLNGFMGKITK